MASIALVPPAGEPCFTVFSQRADARIDAAEWTRHAERFFGTRIEIVDAFVPLPGAPEPADRRNAANVRVTSLQEHAGARLWSGERICRSRPRSEDDLRVARTASGGAGLDALAARCPQIWQVTATNEAPEDALALRLAAILAGILLGPILSPGGLLLFGPKTARQRLGL